jgi:hypothetical protein
MLSTLFDVLCFNAGLKSAPLSGMNAIVRLYVEFPWKEVP